VAGTRTVLTVAQELGIPRVVYISSTAVYGVPKIHPLYEDHELVGVGPYGESKIEAEQVCEKFRAQGLCVPIIRPKTFIGTARLGVFQILYDWVESGCRIPLIGNGKNHYQLLEVEDLCTAIWLCATAPSDRVNDTFNVGAEEYGTVEEDVGALCDYAGNGARVMTTPAWLVKPALAALEALHLSPLYKWVYGTADTDSYVAVDKMSTATPRRWSARISGIWTIRQSPTQQPELPTASRGGRASSACSSVSSSSREKVKSLNGWEGTWWFPHYGRPRAQKIIEIACPR